MFIPFWLLLILVLFIPGVLDTLCVLGIACVMLCALLLGVGGFLYLLAHAAHLG